MATETLRPNAAGDETNIHRQWPVPASWEASHEYSLTNLVQAVATLTGFTYECTTAGTSGETEPVWGTTVGGTTADGTVTWTCRSYHWDKVDEAEADEGSTRVQNSEVAGWMRDLYNLPASSGAGPINFIKIYFRCDIWSEDAEGKAKPCLKSNGTITEGDEVAVALIYTTYSQQWNTNPADAGAWEWADIDALQIGVSLKTGGADEYTYCTQVYVEVDYTPPVTAPTVTTQAVSSIGTTTATGNGTIVATGGQNASAWGVCYNTTGNPTTADSTAAGSGAGGVGAFTAAMSGLASPMKYYVKAYATNTGGTGYGAQVTFVTKMTASVLVGDLVTSTRVFSRIRASAAIAGIVASTTLRIYGRVRPSSVLIGNLVTATRGVPATFTRVSSVLVGNLVTASQNITMTRVSNVIVGVLVTATQGQITTLRASSVIVGVKVTTKRLYLSFTRASSVLVGNLVTAIAQTGVQRAIVYIGIKLVANRNITKQFASSVIVGIVVTATKGIAFTASAAVIVGVVATAIIRMWGRIRTSSTLIGNKVTASRKLALTIDTSSVIIGIVVTATRGRIATTRKAAIKVGILVSAFGLRVGRLLKMVVFGRDYYDMNVHTKPQFDMEVSNDID